MFCLEQEVDGGGSECASFLCIIVTVVEINVLKKEVLFCVTRYFFVGVLDPEVRPAHSDGGPGLLHQRSEVLPHPSSRLRRMEPPNNQPWPQGKVNSLKTSSIV
jgi:hypothetical protein